MVITIINLQSIEQLVKVGVYIFLTHATDLEEVDDDGSAIVAADRTDANYTKNGDLITLPFTEQLSLKILLLQRQKT